MNSSEWGPKDVPLVRGQLQEIGRFRGSQLKLYADSANNYLSQNPSTTRNELISSVTTKPKEARQMNDGLDVLNQLHVVGKGPEDVSLVIVREDKKNSVPSSPDSQRPHFGKGQPDRFYEIVWLKAPEKPAPQKPAKPTHQKLPSPQNRLTPEQLEVRENDRKRFEAREKRRKEKEEERKSEDTRRERQAIDAVIIDQIAEMTDGAISLNSIKFEPDESGKVTPFYREFFWRKDYTPIDRETGKYNPTPQHSITEQQFSPQFMSYLNYRADLVEGKEVSYSPDPLDPSVVEDIYQRALKASMLSIEKDDSGNVSFSYTLNSYFLLGILLSGQMDLENNKVISSDSPDRTRPIHPDFSAYLKKKKEELENNQ